MKNKYHSKGISKNKKIREERKKPLPLQLMINGKWKEESNNYIKTLGINK